MVVFGSFGLLAVACAASLNRPSGRMGVTNLQAVDEPRYSPEVSSVPDTTMAHGPVVDPRTSEAADALGAHDYAKVLELTESPSKAPTGAWLDYDRGSALVGLGRTDEAVESFKRAEVRFEQAGDDGGRAAALWGRARAYDEVGRCSEARAAYGEYEAFVRPSDSRAAEMAAAYAGMCRPVVVLH